jgi:hypothetical protein
MIYQFMKDNSSIFPIEKMASVLNVSSSSYYDWLGSGTSNHDLRDQELTTEITRVFRKFRNKYGSPRIYGELRGTPFACGRARIARLMRENSLVARQKKRFVVTTDSKHVFPVAPNRLNFNTHPGKRHFGHPALPIKPILSEDSTGLQ